LGKTRQDTTQGRQACLYGYKVNYYNMQKLNEAINMARIESRISKFFDKLSDTDLLIVDDFGLVKLSGQQLIDFMRLLKTGMQEVNHYCQPAPHSRMVRRACQEQNHR